MSASVSRSSPRGPGIARVRSQAAAARALLDELERSSHPGLSEQVAEELESLGRSLVEVARGFLEDDDRSAGE
jgi:hypothetical protein